MPREKAKLPPRFFLILMLGLLSTISPFSIDMYLPAFPEIATDLRTSVAKIALSVSSYFIGLALAQVLYGPVLDRFGRKAPLHIGLLLYVIASLACMRANSIEALITFRFCQALGGCVAMVASTAMVRDFFPARESAKVFSLIMLVIGVSPLLAPSLGSFIAANLGWKAVFAILAIHASLVGTLIFIFLPEAHVADRKVSLKPLLILHDFRAIFQEPQFFVYSLAGALNFAGLFAYVAGSPAIFLGEFHVGPKAYGGIFAALSVALIGGSQLNLWLVRRYANEKIFATALTCQSVVGLLFLGGKIGRAHV